MIHELKTWPPFFLAVQTQKKTFEVRKNDRDYREGDVLLLREWDPTMKAFTGKSPLTRLVTYVMNGPAFGVEAGYVVLGLSNLEFSHDVEVRTKTR